MPEARLARTRRAYDEHTVKFWYATGVRLCVNYESAVDRLRVYDPPRARRFGSCHVCGGTHSDGSVCQSVTPVQDDQDLWGV